MTRQTQTQTQPQPQPTTDQSQWDLIAKYPYGQPDAAKRHAGAIGGHRVLNDETGYWEVFGNVHAEADRALRATSDKALLRKYARVTHSIHEAKNPADRIGRTRAEHRALEADLRATRDRIEAEALRRMGGE